MGWKYEVRAGGHYHLNIEEYETFYTGNSLLAAIRAAWRAYKDGFVLITLIRRQ